MATSKKYKEEMAKRKAAADAVAKKMKEGLPPKPKADIKKVMPGFDIRETIPVHLLPPEEDVFDALLTPYERKLKEMYRKTGKKPL